MGIIVGGQKGSYLAKMCFSPLFKGVFDTHPMVKRVQFGYFWKACPEMLAGEARKIAK